jgi:hypothetical protein
MKTLAFTTLLMLAALSRADTVINVDNTVLRPGVQRFGIGLAQHNYYDSNQMMKELLFRNPGFEGLLYQSVVRLGQGGTASSAIEDQAFTQWPSGFWAGASYEIIWSSGNTKGRSGTITNSLAPNRANPPNDPSGSAQGTTYLFADSDAAHVPLDGDYMMLRKTEVGGTGGGAAFASWSVSTGGGGMVTSETADLPPGTAGQQCARLDAAVSGQQAGVTGQFDTLTGFIRLNGQFRLAFKAKGVGGANRAFITVRRGSLTPYLSQTVQLTSEWADYSLPFSVSEDVSTSGTISVGLSATNQSAILIDDVSLRQTDSSATNPTEFRDDVVSTLEGLRPGILRYVNWQQVGDSLANALSPLFGRKRTGYSVYATSENNMMPGLHEFSCSASISARIHGIPCPCHFRRRRPQTSWNTSAAPPAHRWALCGPLVVIPCHGRRCSAASTLSLAMKTGTTAPIAVPPSHSPCPAASVPARSSAPSKPRRITTPRSCSASSAAKTATPG